MPRKKQRVGWKPGKWSQKHCQDSPSAKTTLCALTNKTKTDNDNVNSIASHADNSIITASLYYFVMAT